MSSLDAVFTAMDTDTIGIPIPASRANAIAEPFVGSIRRHLLAKIRMSLGESASAASSMRTAHAACRRQSF